MDLGAKLLEAGFFSAKIVIEALTDWHVFPC